MKKTSKLTRVLAGFAALLMCGATMTGCSEEDVLEDVLEDGGYYYLNGDSKSGKYIRIDDEETGDGYIQNVEYYSSGPITGNCTLTSVNKSTGETRITMDKGYYNYSGETIVGYFSEDDNTITVERQIGSKFVDDVYSKRVKSSTK